MAVAIQPARPATNSPIAIPTSRPNQASPHAPRRLPPPKDNAPLLKPTAPTSVTSNIRSRRERPCDACRRRKSRCVINPGASLCVLCEFHKQDCTFLQDPQPRKRKVPAAADQKDSSTKKRYVVGCPLYPTAPSISQCMSCAGAKPILAAWLFHPLLSWSSVALCTPNPDDTNSNLPQDG